MDNLQAILDQLEDSKLTYVIERSKVTTDAAGYENAGIPKSTFYKWSAEERDLLNGYAQQLKRNRALAAEIVLTEAAEDAARLLVKHLKSRNENVAQRAATEILDRTAGSPTQKHEVSVTWRDIVNQARGDNSD